MSGKTNVTLVIDTIQQAKWLLDEMNVRIEKLNEAEATDGLSNEDLNTRQALIKARLLVAQATNDLEETVEQS